MSRLRLLIVDDEPLIRAGIRAALSAIGDVEIVAECEDVAGAAEAIRSLAPDLVLLDIQLPDGTGFDLVRRVGPGQMPPVVFVTAYDEFAIRAFEVNAVDYLLKPFDEDRLRESIQRARQRLAMPSETIARQLEAVLRLRERQWPARLVVRGGDRFDFVPVDTVDWIESANNYVHLHCGSRSYLLGESLTSLEERLDPEQFLRVHRCYIVNIGRIVAVHMALGGTYDLELQTGVHVRTGRQYREAIQKLVKA